MKMNKKLQSFGREFLKENLKKCNDAQQTIFKRMYSNGNLGLTIEEVVDRMPESKIDWAMQQVSRTLDKP